MISKSILKQYIDLQEEIKEVNERITKSKNRISEIEKEIDKLKCNKKMIQKRKEDFFTDDILIPETDIMIENLIIFKSLYIDRIFTLNTLIEKISIQIREIKEFEQSINDYFIKKIFDLRIPCSGVDFHRPDRRRDRDDCRLCRPRHLLLPGVQRQGEGYCADRLAPVPEVSAAGSV